MSDPDTRCRFLWSMLIGLALTAALGTTGCRAPGGEATRYHTCNMGEGDLVVRAQYTPGGGWVVPALPTSPTHSRIQPSHSYSAGQSSRPLASSAGSTTSAGPSSGSSSPSVGPPAPALAPAPSQPAYGNPSPPGPTLLGPGEAQPPPRLHPNDETPNDNPFARPLYEEEITRELDLFPKLVETRTGRLMFGVGVNSDAGLTGSIVIDEQNFDWARFPRSWEEIRNATAWRGAGQRFRLEAIPGTEVQRYMISFTEPYLNDSQVSLRMSGHYYDRRYLEWDENRLGGRISVGYEFTKDLSGSIGFRSEKIGMFDPVIPTPPELTEVLGDSSLYGFELRLTHDKRDSAFMATRGHLIEFALEQVVGSFEYPRGEIDLRKYFRLYQRADGSGAHVLSLKTQCSLTGHDTPIYDHYYAGGFSTIRGFNFRGASPQTLGVMVGGHFRLLASAEYMFPITADDMIRAVVFCDTGTVQPSIDDWTDSYRVAPGVGMRIMIPAMGPAPIALDFAFPISKQDGDRTEVFSFYLGVLR